MRELISSDLGQDEGSLASMNVSNPISGDDSLFEAYLKNDLDATYYFIENLKEGVINEKTH